MIEIREEKISEQRETENVVREAFWNVYSPGCSDHYLVHQIRQCPAYIPQLNLVAVKNETIVGHVINIKSYISGDDGRNYEVISLGPISVLPQYQRTGVGSKLISEVKKIAKQSGYRAILLYGNPAFYLKQGFEPAEKYGIRNSENMFAAAEQDNSIIVMNDAVEALVSLGYSSKDAIKAVKKVDDIDKKNSEAILKEALKSLATL